MSAFGQRQMMSSARDSQWTEPSKSWIDDLPVCKHSGIGFSTNQIYREDGNRREEHAFEDRSFHCVFHNDNTSFLYGVFDGYEGVHAVDFCFQKMPAEILLGQLSSSMSDEDIEEVLRQAFSGVESDYMVSLNDLLAERASFDVPDGTTPYAYFKEDELKQLNSINQNVSSGASAAIALIYNKTLFVGNVGNCRVLLCETDPSSALKVVQLSTDHNTRNEDEILRLSQLGLEADELRKHLRLGNQDITRCLGNYLVKGGFKELEDLVNARHEPITAVPDIIGGIKLNETHRFLLLMTSGLYKAVEEAMGSAEVNQYIATCVVDQFREQTTIIGVAQAVVDKVVRLHHDWYMATSLTNSNYDKTREDMTLLVRNFNFPLPNAIRSASVSFNPIVVSTVIATIPINTLTNTSTYNSGSYLSTIDSTSSSETAQSLPDPNRRIEPYVDFKQFYINAESAKKNGTLPSGLLT